MLVENASDLGDQFLRSEAMAAGGDANSPVKLRVKTTAWGVENLRGLIERLGR
jgi:hypothetical protein